MIDISFNNLKPIRTEADYDAALKQINALWDAPDGSIQSDCLEILVTLVQAYEVAHHPIPPPDPIEAILHEMESQGLTRKDLESSLGSRARVSEVLNRKRPLTLAMIRKLQQNLNITADVLVQPYQLA